jgi:tight adherence protein B
VTWFLLALGVLALPLGSVQVQRLGGLIGSPAARAPGGRGWRSSAAKWGVRAGAVVLMVAARRFGSLAIAAGIAVLCAVRFGALRRQRRADAAAEVEALAVVRSIVAELDAGRQVDQVVGCVGGMGVGGAGVGGMGGGGEDGIGVDGGDSAPRSRDGPGAEAAMIAVGHARRVSIGSGAPMSAVLAVVVDDLVAEHRRRTAVAAALAGTRSSALLMAALPLLGLALGASLGAAPLTVLGATATGHLLVVFAVALEAAGLLWTDAIAVRAGRG